jgi:hypothetical protein
LPGGTALREDMLVGCGEKPRDVVKAHIESDPYARTEQVAAEERALSRDEPRPNVRVAIVVAVVVVAVLAAAALLLGR